MKNRKASIASLLALLLVLVSCAVVKTTNISDRDEGLTYNLPKGKIKLVIKEPAKKKSSAAKTTGTTVTTTTTVTLPAASPLPSPTPAPKKKDETKAPKIEITTSVVLYPDQTQEYLLNYNRSVLSSDDVKVTKNNKGFLTKLDISSQDESGEIVVTLAKTAFSIVTLAATGFPSIDLPDEPDSLITDTNFLEDQGKSALSAEELKKKIDEFKKQLLEALTNIVQNNEFLRTYRANPKKVLDTEFDPTDKCEFEIIQEKVCKDYGLDLSYKPPYWMDNFLTSANVTPTECGLLVSNPKTFSADFRMKKSLILHSFLLAAARIQLAPDYEAIPDDRKQRIVDDIIRIYINDEDNFLSLAQINECLFDKPKAPDFKKDQYQPDVIARQANVKAHQTCPDLNSGICYRPMAPHMLTFSNNNIDKSQTYLLPNGTKIVSFNMKRASFVKVVYGLKFTDGVLTEVHLNKPSEVLGAVKIPLQIAEALVALPAQIFKLRVDYSTSQKTAFENEKLRLEAEKAIFDLQNQIRDLKDERKKEQQGNTGEDDPEEGTEGDDGVVEGEI